MDSLRISFRNWFWITERLSLVFHSGSGITSTFFLLFLELFLENVTEETGNEQKYATGKCCCK